MLPQLIVLIVSAVALGMGMIVRYWHYRTRGASNRERRNVEWLFFSMFSVLVIFSFFPYSDAAGDIKGFSLTGAFAGFVLMWWLGSRSGNSAAYVDAIVSENVSLRSDLHVLQVVADRHVLSTSIRSWRLNARAGVELDLVTGSIGNVLGYDVWVSSENTVMEPARFFDASISGAIRFMAATFDERGQLVGDTIGRELVTRMDGATYVPPGHVLVTGSGQLLERNAVERVFHVAAVEGAPGTGYRQVSNIATCMQNLLAKVDELNASGVDLRSLLVPLLGAGAGGGDATLTARILTSATIGYLLTHSNSSIVKVGFIAPFEREAASLIAALAEYAEIRCTSS